jgi:hypothetical protein
MIFFTFIISILIISYIILLILIIKGISEQVKKITVKEIVDIIIQNKIKTGLFGMFVLVLACLSFFK